MKVPCFPHDGHNRGAAVDQGDDVTVVFRLHAFPTGHREGCQFRILPFHVTGDFKELVILRVAPWPTCLYVVDAEFIQFLGNADFVFQRETDAFRLCTVTQSRVVKENSFGTRQETSPPCRGCHQANYNPAERKR